MRVALISDIHSNYEAFSAVAGDIVSQNVNGICVLGDILGYGADPSLCLRGIMVMFGRGGSAVPPVFAELAGKGKAIVAGNHDLAAIGGEVIRRFNPRARAAAEWTIGRLDEEEKRFIATLPVIAEFEGATLVHSSPENPSVFGYILGAADARIALENSDNDLVFIGHTHRPMIYELGEMMAVCDFKEGFTLKSGARYIVNVGSVGQPRDGDNRAAYVIWDMDVKALTMRRIKYDIKMAADKIRTARLPEELGNRLHIGR